MWQICDEHVGDFLSKIYSQASCQIKQPIKEVESRGNAFSKLNSGIYSQFNATDP